MRKRARRPAVQFLPRLRSFAVLNSSGFSLRAGSSDWPLLLLSNLFSSQPQNRAIPLSFCSATFGIPRCWGVVSQRCLLIGHSGRSAFSVKEPQANDVFDWFRFGFRLPSRSWRARARRAIPRRLLRGRRGAGRCKAGWGRKEAEDE